MKTLTQFHGVILVTIYSFAYTLCYAFCSDAMCVYVLDFMLNVSSL
jgi:hypothetical protein